MTHTPPPAPTRPARRSIWERFSFVWIIPIASLLIAFGAAAQVWFDRGPLIEIAFEDASGVRAGDTELRYKDVAVGAVEDVRFSDGLDQVIVAVRLSKEIAPFVDEDANFWVIRPEVTTQGISGLDTVLSGVFIEGNWDNLASGMVATHDGLAAAPVLRAGQEGIGIRLRAGDGVSLVEGTPILFKGLVVGRVGIPTLDASASAAEANAIVFAPYDKLISSATRFWDTSGFTFSIGAAGATLDFSSMAALLSGGVTFDTIVSGGKAVSDGDQFEIFTTESAARASLFSAGEGELLNLTVIFDENVSGLAPGAPVELDGLRIGEVATLTGLVDAERFGDEAVRLLATIAIGPARLGLNSDDPDAPLQFFVDRVADGLRARLASASILTGGLKIELVTIEGVARAALDVAAEPYPVLPTTQSDISDVSASAEGVFQRINDLPVEQLIASAIGFLDTATALAADEDLRRLPDEALALLGDARGLVTSDETQALPAQFSTLLQELTAASADMRAVVASVREADAVARLLGAIDAAQVAMGSLEASVEGVPGLVEQLDAVAQKANALPVDDLVAQLSETAVSLEAFLTADGTKNLPASLSSALGEMEAALAELREGGAVTNVNRALQSAGDAAEALEQATGSLPDLVARLNALVRNANAAVAGYDSRSDFGRSAREALREIERAADAVASLARALERRPNSVILGR